MSLYPPLAPRQQFHLPVSGGHRLYVEECGNPQGRPVLVVHGGPGAGCSPHLRRFFDPQHWRIILFDQRGAGRSEPLAETQHNTTDDLVADMERLRQHFGIERWMLFGGSWGATLSPPASVLGRIPGVIVHGRLDLVCPAEQALILHEQWPGSRLVMVEGAGHSVREPGIQAALLEAVASLVGVGEEA